MFEGLGCILWGKKLYESKFFHLSGHLIFDHADVFDGGYCFKEPKDDLLFCVHHDWSTYHKTTGIDVTFIFVGFGWGWRYDIIVKFTVVIFLVITTVTFISSGKILVITFITVPIVRDIEVDSFKGMKVYTVGLTRNEHCVLETFLDG
jgi:hypothetical protein